MNTGGIRAGIPASCRVSAGGGIGLFARLVVADPRTGADVAVTAGLLFGSLPSACTGGTDVCTTSRSTPDGAYQTHRLVVATGEYRAEKTGLPPYARAISSDGLVDLGSRDPETIALVRDGAVRWRTPLSEAFPRKGFSTDNGWTWMRYEKSKIYVGSVFGGSLSPGRKYPVVRDLTATATATATAALDESTGDVLWRDAGSKAFCSGLYITAPDGETWLPVRCRSRGTLTWQENGDTSVANLDVVVEGFDPKTGKTTWSAPVGASEGLVGGKSAPTSAGGTDVLLRTGAGPILLDVATGRQRPPAAGEVFWCGSTRDFRYRTAYRWQDGRTADRWSGGTVAATCDGSGRPATGTPSGPATAAAGADLGPYAVVATATGFTGYRIA